MNYRSSNTAAHQEDTVVSGVSNAKLPFLRLSSVKIPDGNPVCFKSLHSLHGLQAAPVSSFDGVGRGLGWQIGSPATLYINSTDHKFPRCWPRVFPFIAYHRTS